ncbi:PREDICTED: zinc finger BED domain-containing protein 4-like [Rhagoletis zephyria]|uniref:zinc finger BED domain-containing protein 4-like n=1 Tax=Rhagoletis zephyria TaxID=28612 RepID=UPI0008119EFE|nr:PREDICTED: zinc finger BED domain-containing protein 4-like [Rhagoletis zephyria]
MCTKSFLGVTAHYIENNKIMSRCLETKELDERHTADYIAENLRAICAKFHVETSKITCVVTDNGANMVAAVNSFVGRSSHLSCFAHSFNLVVETVYKLEPFCALTEKIRNVVKFFKNSVVYSDKLRSAQSCNSPKKPVLDVRTRWNSLYYMLDRYVELAPVIHQILLLDSKAPHLPTALELKTIEEILDVLKPFEIATKEISGENFVTVSKVIPIVKTLRAQMRNEMLKNASSDLVLKMKTLLNNQLTTRFKNIEDNHILALSCVLDPRFKNIAFLEPHQNFSI